MISKVLVLLSCVVLVFSGVVMAGTASWWNSAACPGTAASSSTVPVDGTCFSLTSITGVQSASISCVNGAFIGQLFSTANCPNTGLVGTGAGLGDGNTCVAVTTATSSGSTKINCNSANKIGVASFSLALLSGLAVLALLSM